MNNTNTTNNINNSNIPINNKTEKYDIHKRIYVFVVSVIKLVNSLPKTPSNYVIVNQILRSVTSMGANDQEADGTLSKKDFIYCYTIVRKESKETLFWLMLIADTNPSLKESTNVIIIEVKELIAIISTIINNTRKK